MSVSKTKTKSVDDALLHTELEGIVHPKIINVILEEVEVWLVVAGGGLNFFRLILRSTWRRRSGSWVSGSTAL